MPKPKTSPDGLVKAVETRNWKESWSSKFDQATGLRQLLRQCDCGTRLRLLFSLFFVLIVLVRTRDPSSGAMIKQVQEAQRVK